MSRYLKGMAILLACCASVAWAKGAATPQRYPSYVRLSLAGGRLQDEASYLKYDPKERYYLIATGDCDGASLDLVLTADPSPWGIDPSEGDAQDADRVALPRLRTGSGVNIGDSPTQVRRKLGRSPHRARYSRRTPERVWEYETRITIKRQRDKRPAPTGYRATYTFRNERLWQIHYNMGDG